MQAKKKLLSIFVLIIVLFTCLMFPACKDNGVIGTYKLYQIVETDETFNLGDEWDGNTLTEDFYTLMLFDNERFRLSGVLEGVFEGFWAQADDTVLLQSDYPYDDDMVLTYSQEDNTLTLVGNDYNIVWKK